ncbi:MAG: nicotinate (nicotinamide) nucleotide adenylyltransferase [Chthoniobacterales bacterium]|nr:nicotinate (nicotinamide) nucleotide adenylyltransferase [Chthoniobacterales bacterium]
MENPSRIGLFGGTFDPVHLGHLILAHDALEALKLDLLFFIPAALAPHKKETPPLASAAQRVAMLQLAIKGESRFVIDERELSRKAPSYTIDTVRELEKEYPSRHFFLLVGEDQNIDQWKEIDELQKKVHFVFFSRANHRNTVDDFTLLRRRIDISSTEIRERLALGKPVCHLLPPTVAHYLEKKSLYRP